MKINEKKVLAVVDAILGAFISIYSNVYGLFTGRKVPTIQIDGNKRTVFIAVCLSIIGICLLSLIFPIWEWNPAPSNNQGIALGEGMAEETCRLLGKKGQVVVVRPEGQGSPLLNKDAQIKAFMDVLSRKEGVTVVGVESLRPATPPPAPPPLFSFPVLSGILEKYPNVSAIVSFVGIPRLTDEEIAKLDPKIPKILVLEDFSTPPLQKVLEEGVVQAAIVRRPKNGPGPMKKLSPKKYFEQYYQVVRSEAVSAQPSHDQTVVP